VFGTYLRRELLNRRKQTIIIAIGMALAIALVIVVTSVSSGVKSAQASALQSVYGVGTDITITQPAATGSAGGGPAFAFGAGAGTENGTSRSVASSRLSTGPGTTTMAATDLTTVEKVDGVKSAAGVLSLNNTSFTGTLPNFQEGSTSARPGSASSSESAPTGGADGAGGSSFSVDSFTVLGVDTSGSAVGPLSSAKLTSGTSFTSADADKDVAVVDATYATSKSLKVGSTLSIGGSDFTVIGIVTSTGSNATTAANTYIPLTVAQNLSGETGKISSIYVQAASASDISSLKTRLSAALPKATVSTEADLASSVSGSLGTASQLVSNLGTWLSLIVLAAAFLIAILFTISGVSRRTREFGTLKAIGWSDRRIVGQVAGESVVQGLIGGVVGILVGLAGILVVNMFAPTLSSGPAAGASGAAGHSVRSAAGAASGAGGAGGPFGRISDAASATSSVALHAPVTVTVILAAVGLAVLGGLLAGAIGGWRASRLRPAAALRSVA
jgi:ABC-type antimicrobial peptide transport system permease subunit